MTKNPLTNTLKMSYRIGRNAFLSPKPFLLYFKPTARCDLRCNICNRWKDNSTSEQELSLEQIQSMLTKFYNAGASVLTLWGGEPTLRKDLAEILHAAKQIGYRTSMCSNCNSLGKKSDRILPHLDTLLCSLDGLGKTHDEMRGINGLFDRVVNSIKLATEYDHCRVKIWSTVHVNNLDQIEGLAELAKDLSVGIEYFPVSPIVGYNNEMVPSSDDLQDAFARIKGLKRDGFPVWNPDRVLDKMQTGSEFKCNFARIAIHMDHEGNVYTCENPAGTPLHQWDHYENIDLGALFRSTQYKEVTDNLASCGQCRLPCVLELADELPVALAGMFMQSFVR